MSKCQDQRDLFPGNSWYLYEIVCQHRYDAKPQNPLLPRDAFGQLQQRYCKGCLRETLTQQSQTGSGVDKNVHSIIPDRAHVARGELYADDDVVDRKDQLRDCSQCTVRSESMW
jgi:hypothetical protein